MILTDAIFGQRDGIRKVINTFITGASDVTNKTDLATALKISAQDISVFEKTGEDVSAAVNTEYALLNMVDLGENLKTFNDAEGKVVTLGQLNGAGLNANFTNAIEFYFPNATAWHGHKNINYDLVLYNQTFRKLWIPKVVNFTGGLNFFETQSPELRIYVNPTLETSNNGDWHPVLNSWKAHNARIMFVRSLLPPNAPDQSIIQTVTPVYVKLGDLSNGNYVDSFELYENGVLFQKGMTNNILNLTPETQYSLDLVIRDSSDQITPQGAITFTTPSSNYVTRKMEGYYNLDENNLNGIIDYSGKNLHGYTPDGATIQEEGKFSFSYYLYRQKIVIPFNKCKAVAMWVKPMSYDYGTYSYLIDFRLSASAYIFSTGGAGFSKMYVNGILQANIKANNMTLGVWQHVYVELTTAILVPGAFTLGNQHNLTKASMVAYFDVMSSYREALTEAEILQLVNNGNGVQL